MAATMTQLNVRVNTEQRRQAEEVLGLMGESLTKLIRGVVEKVSQGVEEAEEVYSVLKGTPAEEIPLTNRVSTAITTLWLRAWASMCPALPR